jgi:hypothetical protein
MCQAAAVWLVNSQVLGLRLDGSSSLDRSGGGLSLYLFIYLSLFVLGYELGLGFYLQLECT